MIKILYCCFLFWYIVCLIRNTKYYSLFSIQNEGDRGKGNEDLALGMKNFSWFQRKQKKSLSLARKKIFIRLYLFPRQERFEGFAESLSDKEEEEENDDND